MQNNKEHSQNVMANKEAQTKRLENKTNKIHQARRPQGHRTKGRTKLMTKGRTKLKFPQRQANLLSHRLRSLKKNQ